MAGGNLSPRQKMINMMYLVLTALLALNVSAEILHSFEQIGDSLRNSAFRIAGKNSEHSSDIKAHIEDEIKQNNKRNEKYIAEVENINKKTNDMIGQLESLVDSMKKIGEVDKESGRILNLSDTERNYRFWMMAKGKETDNGGRGAGYGKELRDKLSEYIDWANKWNADNKNTAKFPYIAVDPKDDPNIKNTPANREIRSKTWEYVTFHGSPLIANVAILEKLKSDVANVQTEMLGYLESLVGQVPFKIDSIMAFDAPMSAIVPAGLKFETKLFVAMSSKQVKPQFAANVKKSADGNTGTLTIPASITNGQQEQEIPYSSTLRVPKADGTWANLTVKGKFKVVRPVAQFTSNSALALYKGCGNDLRIDVPALGVSYNPIVSASQSVTKPGKTKYDWIIIPSGDKCIISVSSNTNGQVVKVGDYPFNVKTPPKPAILITSAKGKWDGASAINKKETVNYAVEPDREFLAALPADARYKIKGMSVKVQEGLGPPEPAPGFSNVSSGVAARPVIPIPLGQVTRGAGSSASIIVEADEIVRVNYLNAEIKEVFSRQERAVQFKTKNN